MNYCYTHCVYSFPFIPFIGLLLYTDTILLVLCSASELKWYSGLALGTWFTFLFQCYNRLDHYRSLLKVLLFIMDTRLYALMYKGGLDK